MTTASTGRYAVWPCGRKSSQTRTAAWAGQTQLRARLRIGVPPLGTESAAWHLVADCSWRAEGVVAPPRPHVPSVVTCSFLVRRRYGRLELGAKWCVFALPLQCLVRFVVPLVPRALSRFVRAIFATCLFVCISLCLVRDLLVHSWSRSHLVLPVSLWPYIMCSVSQILRQHICFPQEAEAVTITRPNAHPVFNTCTKESRTSKHGWLGKLTPADAEPSSTMEQLPNE